MEWSTFEWLVEDNEVASGRDNSLCWETTATTVGKLELLNRIRASSSYGKKLSTLPSCQHLVVYWRIGDLKFHFVLDLLRESEQVGF